MHEKVPDRLLVPGDRRGWMLMEEELAIGHLALVHLCHKLQVLTPFGDHLSDFCFVHALEVEVHTPQTKWSAWWGTDDQVGVQLFTNSRTSHLSARLVESL